MKTKALLFITTLVAATAGQAQAAGCLKGAVVGGVGGHFIGKGHALLGAAGGCLVGRHMANKKAQENGSKENGSAQVQGPPSGQGQSATQGASSPKLHQAGSGDAS